MNRPEVFLGVAYTKLNEDGELIDERTIGSVIRFMEFFAKWVDRMG